MKFLDKLEKRMGFLAVPNVVLTIIIAQVFIYGAVLIGQVGYGSVILEPKAVMSGEWWRIFSFLIAPPFIAVHPLHAVFLAFYWYIFWMMSSALESVWGVFRFNLYLLLGVALTILGALIGHVISPGANIQLTTMAISMSIFFAFATLHPNIEFLVMFVLPVKVKWLAWFTAVITALSILGATSMGDRVAILAPLFNYFLFFREGFNQSVQSRQRRKQFDVQKRVRAAEALHTCAQCGASDKSEPDRDFRYKIIDGDAVCVCDECRSASS